MVRHGLCGWHGPAVFWASRSTDDLVAWALALRAPGAVKAVTGLRCRLMSVTFKEGNENQQFWRTRRNGAPWPLSSLCSVFAPSGLVSHSYLSPNFSFWLCLCLRPSLPGISLDFSTSVFVPSHHSSLLPSHPSADDIPILPGHQTLTCEVSEPGHGPLPTCPCRGRRQQQQEQLEEEKAQETPWVQAQGWKGHAEPNTVTRWP